MSEQNIVEKQLQNEDEKYMREVIKEAKKGVGYVNPNPLVGALAVKENKILEKDFHRKYGKFHAERNLLLKDDINFEGSTLYVNLEPCCHFGKTPPCTQIIKEKKIKRVVIGMLDPNPLVAGKGAQILKDAGIDVTVGVLENECKKLNEGFMYYIKTKKPYIVSKFAMTADGKIATKTGHSKWISGEKSREDVHKLRAKYSGIMVGINTVLKDDPMLDCRLNLENKPKNPARIICDTNLKIPLNSKIVKTAKNIKTYIMHSSNDVEKIEKLEKNGCICIYVQKKNEHINLQKMVERLGEIRIDSILLEGGAILNYSMFNEKLVNKVVTYIAPKIIGGEDAKTPVEGEGVSLMDESFKLKNPEVEFFGEDICIKWYVEN